MMRAFYADQRGAAAVLFGMMAIPLAVAAGGVVDYNRASNNQAKLTSAIDAATLAAAKARGVTDQERVVIASNILASNGLTGLQVSAASDGSAVTVSASSSVKTSFLGLVGIDKISISARSTAKRTMDGPPACAVALNTTANGAITFAGTSSFIASDCSVYSNSSSPSALSIQGSAHVVTAGFCVVGGASVPSGLTPSPITGCDPVIDTYAKLAGPSSTACQYRNLQVKPGTMSYLSPGVYCGGLDIKGTAELGAGLYVIKDGPLTISSQAAVTGKGVSFYLTGNHAGFTINAGGSINLSAMTSGTYSGMLIVQDRTANPGSTNTLNGSSDTLITGLIYTPTQKLTVTGSSGFGQTAKFLALVADQISFSGSTNAVMDLTAVQLSTNPIRLQTGLLLTN